MNDGGSRMADTNYIITTCNNCGKTIKKRNRGDNRKYYCDTDCYREFQRSGKYKVESRRKGKYVKCSVCKKEYWQTPAISKAVKSNFCSRECYLKHHAIKNKNRECEYCKKIFSARTSSVRFCSKKCEVLRYRDRPENVCTCRQCGKQFCRIAITTTGRTQLKCTSFCTNECMIDYLKTNEDRKQALSKAFTGENHPLWMGGRSYAADRRGTNWKKTREECFKLHSSKCVLCGMTREEHKIRYNCDMHIDHIKPWHSFSKDEKYKANRQDNLRPLCVSCHAKHGIKAKKEDKEERIKEYA